MLPDVYQFLVTVYEAHGLFVMGGKLFQRIKNGLVGVKSGNTFQALFYVGGVFSAGQGSLGFGELQRKDGVQPAGLGGKKFVVFGKGVLLPCDFQLSFHKGAVGLPVEVYLELLPEVLQVLEVFLGGVVQQAFLEYGKLILGGQLLETVVSGAGGLDPKPKCP